MGFKFRARHPRSKAQRATDRKINTPWLRRRNTMIYRAIAKGDIESVERLLTLQRESFEKYVKTVRDDLKSEQPDALRSYQSNRRAERRRSK
jgi:hypothetical protein